MQGRTALLAVAVLCASAGPLSGQQPASAQPPGIVVVSFNKCALDKIATIDSLSALAFYPALDEAVRAGGIQSWGVLTHAWGDEWNHVIYYTAPSLAEFQAAFTAAVQRAQQRRPNMMRDLTQYCTEHKDNIYGVVRTSAATSPPR